MDLDKGFLVKDAYKVHLTMKIIHWITVLIILAAAIIRNKLFDYYYYFPEDLKYYIPIIVTYVILIIINTSYKIHYRNVCEEEYEAIYREYDKLSKRKKALDEEEEDLLDLLDSDDETIVKYAKNRLKTKIREENDDINEGYKKLNYYKRVLEEYNRNSLCFTMRNIRI